MLPIIWQYYIYTLDLYCYYSIYKIIYQSLLKPLLFNLTLPDNQQNYYIDRKPKPKFRGVLHGFGTLFILTMLLASYLSIYHSKELFIFLFGKLCIYFVSALYHLYPFKNILDMEFVYIIDLSVIPLSIHSGITMYSNNTGLGFYNDLKLVCLVIFIIFITMLFKFIKPNLKQVISIIRHSLLAIYTIYVFYIFYLSS